MSSPTVYVFGDTFVDMVTYVAEVPTVGGASWGTQLVPSAGGSGANMAVTLAHLGVDVKFVSCVGNDDWGRFALSNLDNVGVDRALVAVRDDAGTSTCVIMVDSNSERTILVPARGTAGDHLRPSDLPTFADHPVTLLMSGLAIPAEDTGRSAADLVASLPEGSTLFFDPNLRLAPAAVTPELRERYQRLANRADVLLAGEAEIEVLGLERQPGQVLVRKDGVAGSWIVTDEGTKHISALTMDVVNATGAGDAYAATFVAARLYGHDLQEAGELATVGGGLAVTYPSAQAAFTWRDVLSTHESQTRSTHA